MNRRAAILLTLFAAACMLLGIAFGAQVFGCQQDEFGADHTFFKAAECFEASGADGSLFLECSRLVRAGGEK